MESDGIVVPDYDEKKGSGPLSDDALGSGAKVGVSSRQVGIGGAAIALLVLVIVLVAPSDDDSAPPPPPPPCYQTSSPRPPPPAPRDLTFSATPVVDCESLATTTLQGDAGTPDDTISIESAEATVFPEPAAPELSPECKALMDSPSEAFAACRANPGRGHGCGNCVRTNIADFVGCIEGPGGTRPMQSYCQSLQEAANPRPPGPPPPPPPPQVAYCLVKVVVEPAIHICACPSP